MTREFKENCADLWNNGGSEMARSLGLVLAGCLMLFLILLGIFVFVPVETIEEIDEGVKHGLTGIGVTEFDWG
jgi:hypothetical protein